ncbi:putative protein phosphatase 2C 78 [Cardamine amara subsp. amara]|uniref:protein-serine/threonine phosphatase n=1 Tax=Cardamine amara subsp. amara TaxID=228776 RepID=A0ABD1BKH6_CARAN
MAEICYENETVMTKTTATVVKKTKATATRRERSSSQAARRRRMEIRRYKFVSGEQDPVVVDGELQKRRRREAVVYETEKEVVVLCESLSSTSVMSLPDPEAYPKYGVASVCGRRREMEDAVAVHPFFFRQQTEYSSSGFHYYGVYDGHGCSHVAMKCRERLHELVREELESEAADWENSMTRSFTRMDVEVVALKAGGAAKCRCELQRPDCDAVGSTAVVSVVTPEKIIVANCGDSRAVLFRNGKPIPLSSDHKPDRPDELDRIEAAGGRVIYWDGPRVLGVLAMSRAIGDNYLKPYVISKPEVTVTDRVKEDDFIILASDGLWDVISNETACNVVRMCLRGKFNGQLLEGGATAGGGGGDVSGKSCEEAAMLLTRFALARQSSDNVSVVVVDLRRDT